MGSLIHSWSITAGKEAASGQIHNAVCLVMRDRGCPVEDAIGLVNEMATHCVNTFEEAARSLPRTDDVDLWLTGLRQLVRGNVDWHFESERYRGDLGIMKGTT